MHLFELFLSSVFIPIHPCHSSCRFQISTLATNLGVRNIALVGSGLLLANYISAILIAIYAPQVKLLFLYIPTSLDSWLTYFIGSIPLAAIVVVQTPDSNCSEPEGPDKLNIITFHLLTSST